MPPSILFQNYNAYSILYHRIGIQCTLNVILLANNAMWIEQAPRYVIYMGAEPSFDVRGGGAAIRGASHRGHCHYKGDETHRGMLPLWSVRPNWQFHAADWLSGRWQPQCASCLTALLLVVSFLHCVILFANLIYAHNKLRIAHKQKLKRCNCIFTAWSPGIHSCGR